MLAQAPPHRCWPLAGEADQRWAGHEGGGGLSGAMAAGRSAPGNIVTRAYLPSKSCARGGRSPVKWARSRHLGRACCNVVTPACRPRRAIHSPWAGRWRIAPPLRWCSCLAEILRARSHIRARSATAHLTWQAVEVLLSAEGWAIQRVVPATTRPFEPWLIPRCSRQPGLTWADPTNHRAGEGVTMAVIRAPKWRAVLAAMALKHTSGYGVEWAG